MLLSQTSFQEVPDQYDVQQGDVNSSSDSSVMIKIDVGIPNREENRFPKEKWKTLVGESGLFYVLNLCNNTFLQHSSSSALISS